MSFDLDLILRAFSIQHLVLAGIATSGVVLSTLREATDKDYRLTVLADCCADGDEEVHRVLTPPENKKGKSYLIDYLSLFAGCRLQLSNLFGVELIKIVDFCNKYLL